MGGSINCLRHCENAWHCGQSAIHCLLFCLRHHLPVAVLTLLLLFVLGGWGVVIEGKSRGPVLALVKSISRNRTARLSVELASFCSQDGVFHLELFCRLCVLD